MLDLPLVKNKRKQGINYLIYQIKDRENETGSA